MPENEHARSVCDTKAPLQLQLVAL